MYNMFYRGSLFGGSGRRTFFHKGFLGAPYSGAPLLKVDMSLFSLT